MERVDEAYDKIKNGDFAGFETIVEETITELANEAGHKFEVTGEAWDRVTESMHTTKAETMNLAKKAATQYHSAKDWGEQKTLFFKQNAITSKGVIGAVNRILNKLYQL